ncbi:integrase catalytic subunit [Klebsiella pneumoniae]|nr:integrase catalytic subunit [Klebsiella pneumoniae]
MSPNRLQRQFNPDAPDERWVTDITYFRTHEGWLYLAVVVDLFSRKIIGWSMQSRIGFAPYIFILFSRPIVIDSGHNEKFRAVKISAHSVFIHNKVEKQLFGPAKTDR